MHEIEPYYNWLSYYNVAEDELSPYYGKEYNHDLYSETIYGYYVDPAWDFMGSETLYIKVLFVDYNRFYCVIELIGEWNDAINNDIMHFKRNIVEHFTYHEVNKFILIGENILNFHGGDDCYYEEWFDELEEGWIASVNFRDFVIDEMKNYNIDSYVNFGGTLNIDNWRTLKPQHFYKKVKELITRRLGPVL